MRKYLSILLCLALFAGLYGCGETETAQIAATTAPVWEFTSVLCQGTPLTVARLVTENVSCLHDYTLTVSQMRQIEMAELVVISGAGLEDFMSDVLADKAIIDASKEISLLEMESHHHHGEESDHDHHDHEHDPHIWLSPANAQQMAQTICSALKQLYPQHTETFDANLDALNREFSALTQYAEENLSGLNCDHLITFHDGFAYLADAWGFHILEAIEEESGSEASAKELIELIELVRQHQLPAVFTEVNGSPAAAGIICAETGIPSYGLDMAMGDRSYFESMYHNIDTLKEALK